MGRSRAKAEPSTCWRQAGAARVAECVSVELTPFGSFFSFPLLVEGGCNRESGGVIHAEEGNYLLSRC